MEVFELTPDFEDPRFEGMFDLPLELPSLLGNEYLFQDFDRLNGGKLSWQPPRLAHLWTPQPVTGAVPPYHDYPCIGRIPTFSQRAVDALRDCLEPNGELLPLETNVGGYYAYNILTKSEALDVARSKGVFAPETGKETAYSIEYFAFDPMKLTDHSIFRIREYPPAIFVTSEFKDRAEAAGLNGLYFIKVWPFPEGESWEQAEIQRNRARRKKLEPLKGECITVQLGLPDKEATEAEEEHGHRLARQLAEMLAESRNSLSDKFIGAIDHFNTAEKKLHIILACPSADRLMEAMEPWLSSIDWPESVYVEKRYGNPYDEKAKAIRTKIK